MECNRKLSDKQLLFLHELLNKHLMELVCIIEIIDPNTKFTITDPVLDDKHHYTSTFNEINELEKLLRKMFKQDKDEFKVIP